MTARSRRWRTLSRGRYRHRGLFAPVEEASCQPAHTHYSVDRPYTPGQEAARVRGQDEQRDAAPDLHRQRDEGEELPVVPVGDVTGV